MSASLSTDRQITGKDFDCFVSDADGQAVCPKVTTVIDRRTRKIIGMDISRPCARDAERALMMLAVAKDLVALIAVFVFVLAIAIWGSEIEHIILAARGQ